MTGVRHQTMHSFPKSTGRHRGVVQGPVLRELPEIVETQSTRSKGRLKRPFDLLVLVTSHILLAPLIVILGATIAFLIWLEDRGPIFYRQDRVGMNGRVFSVLKFRSMVPNAEHQGPGWTDENDSRVTRVGRMIRRTALDELPQVLSLWKGDMRLVGPRALPTTMHRDATLEEPKFPLRLVGPPGLTGLAQINLPRHCRPGRRLQFDLMYLDRSDLWLDLKIIMISVWLTISGQWGRGTRQIED